MTAALALFGWFANGVNHVIGGPQPAHTDLAAFVGFILLVLLCGLALRGRPLVPAGMVARWVRRLRGPGPRTAAHRASCDVRRRVCQARTDGRRPTGSPRPGRRGDRR